MCLVKTTHYGLLVTDPRATLAYQLAMQGWPRDDVALVVFADHPLDDDIPTKRRFRKAIFRRRRADIMKGRAAFKAGDRHESVRLARACLNDYVEIAQRHGNSYYVDRFTDHLNGMSGPLTY